MISHWFLEVARCPQTHVPLTSAEPELLTRVNQAIAAGQVTNHAQQPVVEPLAAALVTQDLELLYPVHGEIPALVATQAISLGQLASADIGV